jgi:hypothetical protein
MRPVCPWSIFTRFEMGTAVATIVIVADKVPPAYAIKLRAVPLAGDLLGSKGPVEGGGGD